MGYLLPPLKPGLFTGILMPLQSTDVGSTVVELVGYNAHGVTKFSLQDDFRYTVYSAALSGPPWELAQIDGTKVIRIENEIHGPPRVKELCAGMGGIGLGLSHLGCRVVAALELSDLGCRHMKRNYDFDVIQGSVTEEKDLCVLQVSGGTSPSIYSCGFPCQPWSSQGDQLGFLDDRTHAFLGVLRAVFLHGASACLLECVTGAGRNADLQACLNCLARLLGWKVHTVSLDLKLQWPMRRLRWWAVLCPDYLVVHLVPWTCDSRHSSIGHVITEWPIWDPDEEQMLAFDATEAQCYDDPAFGVDDRVLAMTGVCSTVLHSYGHVLASSCPCGCRTVRFSEHRLQQGGIRGFGIWSSLPGVTPFRRHLHSQELGFLLTVPSSVQFAKGRHELPLLGQIAAPLQAVWVGHALVSALGKSQFESGAEALDTFKFRLLAERHGSWSWPDTHAAKQVDMMLFSDDSDRSFLRSGQTTAGDVLRAESISTEWGQRLLLTDGDRMLRPDCLMQCRGLSGPYIIAHVHKTAASEQPRGLISVKMCTESSEEFVFLQAGSFLFEAFWELGWGTNLQIHDSLGHRCFADQRIWHSAVFHVRPLVYPPGPVGFGGCATNHLTASPWTPQPGLGSEAMFNLGWIFMRHAQERKASLHIVQQGFDIPIWLHGEAAFVLYPSGTHFLLIWDQGHWTFARFVFEHDRFHVEHFDGLRRHVCPEVIHWIVEILEIGHKMKCSGIQTKQLLRQTLPHSCGTVALVHLAFFLDLVLPMDFRRLEYRHNALVEIACVHGWQSRSPDVQRLGFGPTVLEQDIVHQLAGILQEHGVPAAKARDRAQQGSNKIGLTAIANALQSSKPWARLKEVASRPPHMFQWVQPDELQAQIRHRAEEKFRIKASVKKHHPQQKRGRAAQDPITVDPEQLILMPHTFKAQGSDLEQIDLAAVKKDVQGIAFASFVEVQPFLQQGTAISEKALAILTTSEIPSDQANGVTCVNLRYPAQYRGTKEPILVTGTLVQLGQKVVERIAGHSSSAGEVKTQTLRLTLFRDMWHGNWADFVRQPFRQVIQAVPTFQICKPPCLESPCRKFHPANSESISHLVLDLWARAFHTLEGRYTKPDNAEYWSALLRVPQSAHLELQRISGTVGLFLEPRCDTGRESDSGYQVVWLQEASFDRVLHLCRVTPNTIAVARIQRKFGIRFAAQHVAVGFKTLRPSDEYLPVTIQKIWRLCPLPFGTLRHGLQKCLSDIGWECKVTQQVGSSSVGTTWEVGASAAPPQTVLRISDADVMVTFVRDAAKTSPVSGVVASTSTRKHLKELCAGIDKPDPWAHGDPWGGYKPQAPAASSNQMTQMEARLRSDFENATSQLKAELKMSPSADVDMQAEASSAMDHRLNVVESNILELKQQNAKLESWVTQVAHSSQAMSQTIQTQAADLSELRSEVQGQAAATQASLQAFQTEIKESMDHGWQLITALLEKRSRHD